MQVGKGLGRCPPNNPHAPRVILWPRPALAETGCTMQTNVQMRLHRNKQPDIIAGDNVCPAAGTPPDGDSGLHRLRAQRAPPGAASRARSFTRQALACWDLAELTDDAQVIVSELLANAIRHAGAGRP